MKHFAMATASTLVLACSTVNTSGGIATIGSQPDAATVAGEATDAGAAHADDGGVGPTNGGAVVSVTGEVTDYASDAPLDAVAVSAGTATVKTSANGAYEIDARVGVPIRLAFSRPNYFGTVDVEIMPIMPSGALERGTLRLMGANVGKLFADALAADTSKALVAVDLVPLASCDDPSFPAGATITVNQPSAKVVYYNGAPDPYLKSAQAGEASPAAVIANAAPGQPLKISVSHPTCATTLFPVTVDGVTYTGKLEPKGNKTLTLHRVYLQ